MELSNKKFLGSIAVVGTIAAVAVFNVANGGSDSIGGTFLASNNDQQQLMMSFNQFISENGKNYLTKEEYNARLSIFKSNYEIVKTHNANNNDFKLAMNSFADLSDAEFEKKMGFKKIDNGFEDDDEEEEENEDDVSL